MKGFILFWLKSLESDELCDLMNNYYFSEKEAVWTMDRYEMDGSNWRKWEMSSFCYDDAFVLISAKSGNMTKCVCATVISLRAREMNKYIERFADLILAENLTIEEMSSYLENINFKRKTRLELMFSKK